MVTCKGNGNGNGNGNGSSVKFSNGEFVTATVTATATPLQTPMHQCQHRRSTAPQRPGQHRQRSGVLVARVRRAQPLLCREAKPAFAVRSKLKSVQSQRKTLNLNKLGSATRPVFSAFGRGLSEIFGPNRAAKRM